jgi:hypothetical protein
MMQTKTTLRDKLVRSIFENPLLSLFVASVISGCASKPSSQSQLLIAATGAEYERPTDRLETKYRDASVKEKDNFRSLAIMVVSDPASVYSRLVAARFLEQQIRTNHDVVNRVVFEAVVKNMVRLTPHSLNIVHTAGSDADEVLRVVDPKLLVEVDDAEYLIRSGIFDSWVIKDVRISLNSTILYDKSGVQPIEGIDNGWRIVGVRSGARFRMEINASDLLNSASAPGNYLMRCEYVVAAGSTMELRVVEDTILYVNPE